MRIATLSIGDELILGQVTDTNAGSIAAALLEYGLRVERHLAVGDREQDIIAALIDLGRSNDVLIVTGGLGPTADDLTAQASARATGRRLLVNDEARSHVRNVSSRLDTLIMCPLNDKQAMIPTKSSLIPNPNGTACGFHFIHTGCYFFFLPGVPSEMKVMLHDSVIPFIYDRVTDKRSIQLMHLNIFGPCESEVDAILQGIARPEQGLHLGICVSFPWMRVTLRAETDNREAGVLLLESASGKVREKLGDYIFSTGDVSMELLVGNLLREKGATLSLAESCTGGMIARKITDIPGSSAYFSEGLVTYGNASKTRHLGVSSEMLAKHGAVSKEVASAMSRGVREISGSDIGLAVTGIAGPDGGTDEKPVGTVFISLSAAGGCWTKRFTFSGSRHDIRTMTSWTALDWLRRYLADRTE